MDAPPRGALMFVRFTAAGLIGLSVLELGLYAGECFVHYQPVQFIHGLLLFLPFVIGVAILVKARAVADWISNKFD
ncbi:MAG: hypothetical protein ACLQAH_05625 [Limisphaerales bacterium]